MVAAYIDLNPLRAGMLENSQDYRWSSYGEAVAGGRRALENYVHMYQTSSRSGAVVEGLSAEEVMMRYRVLIAEEGMAAEQDGLPLRQGERASKRLKRRRGYSREEIDKILEQKGKLSGAELLRCKTRYFTDGVVIGNKVFVDGFFKRVKDRLAGDRSVGSSPLRRIGKVDQGEGGKMVRMYSFRNLQKDVYGETEITKS